MLSALAAAHRAGLIHRDIKPENVLIADDGRVKVADFGLAKAVSADTQHTATGGVLIGTVSYIAPELVVDGRADARADVYAAGVVLYELLTGTKPHEGETPIQVAYKHVHEDVPAPSRTVPGIPAYVDALVARATARDRGQRPADAGVLLHQVHRVSQALAEGVREDPELTADLAPMLLHPDTGAVVETTPRPSRSTRPRWRAAGAVGAVRRPHHLVRAGAGHARRRRTARVPARPAPPAPPRRSRRGPILLVLALLLAAAAGTGAWWFGFARYTATPAVIGLARVAAQDKLEAAGLTAEIGDKAFSETVPAGRVIATDPGAGARVLDGGTVTLTLSLGKERYDVPKVRGLTEDEAQDALLATHLAFGRSIGRYSEKVAKGIVLGSDPKPGTTLRPGAAVNLVVSLGRRPIKVPDWTGRDADQAERALEGRGFAVDRSTEEFSDTVPEGRVVSQSPTSGTLFRGDTVRLVVSRGPELVQVPRGCGPVASSRPGSGCSTSASRSTCSTPPATSASTTSSRSLPVRARWWPRAARSRSTWSDWAST